MEKHQEVFAPPDAKPPKRDVTYQTRLIPEAWPLKRKVYPLPPHKLKVMKEQIHDLHNKGWIEASVSPWGAPILFVPKKNGELRMCVDYRDLNAMTIDDCFPLPRLEVMLHRSGAAKYFSTLDLASGFHQIEVEESTRPLTAFCLPEPVDGSAVWQWTVMPFGLRNAPPTFQRAMSQALVGLDHCAVVYIDDILIYSDSYEEHLQHLDQVFAALKKQRYHVRLQKCEFLKTEVKFLGHLLTQDGISMQKEKVEALQAWETPFTTAKQVKSFLGATAWYQAYIAHYATMAAPLYEITSTKRTFVWTESCERAVQQLKEALLTAPVLVRWQDEKPTRVITDASKVGIGAVLEQQHQDGWRPVSFWSRKLRAPELNYSATDLEWLAVVMAVTRVWHWLLEGRPFTVCSDHAALERKLSKSAHDPPITDRQARWIESLSKFALRFQWIKGEHNTLADALSRNPTCNAVVSVTHSLLAGLRKRMRMLAEHDADYKKLIKQVQSGSTNLKVSEGLIVDAQARICVPADYEIRTLLIAENHDSPMAGHFGMDRTLDLLQRHWFWRGIQKDVREYVQSCAVCQRSKHSTQKSQGLLHPIVASKPWEMITMDFVCGFPRDERTKNAQILVIVDKFTKYVILEPCPLEVDAIQTAEIVIRRVIAEYGVPAVVISDRGPQFAAEVWSKIMNGLGTKVALAATHHPQTDGQSERVIQTLSRVIRAYVRDQSAAWVELLPLFQFALNNSPSSATHLTPFQLIHGRDPVAPPNLMLGDAKDQEGGLQLGTKRRVVQWARDWWKARRRLCKFAAENLRTGAQLMKRRYDVGRRPFKGEVGDLVLLSIKSHPDFGEARKLRARYTGPYVITAKVHENAYKLDGLPPSVPPTQNVEYLRLFFPTPKKFETRPHPATAAGPVQRDGHHEWEVEKITGDELVNGQRRYWVKWKDHEKPSLLRLAQMRNCAEMLRDYQRSKGLALDFWSDSASSLETNSTSEREDSASEDELQPPRKDDVSTKDDNAKKNNEATPKVSTLEQEPAINDPTEADNEEKSDEEQDEASPRSKPQQQDASQQQNVRVTRQQQRNEASKQTFDWKDSD